MKKILPLLLITILLITGCKAKDKLTIKLESNPTTGYEWIYQINNSDVLKLKSNDYKENDKDDKTVGAGGIQTYVFEAVKEGEATITLAYGRNWEENSAYKIEYKIKVDKNKNIEVLDKTGDIDQIVK